MLAGRWGAIRRPISLYTNLADFALATAAAAIVPKMYLVPGGAHSYNGRRGRPGPLPGGRLAEWSHIKELTS